MEEPVHSSQNPTDAYYLYNKWTNFVGQACAAALNKLEFGPSQNFVTKPAKVRKRKRSNMSLAVAAADEQNKRNKLNDTAEETVLRHQEIHVKILENLDLTDLTTLRLVSGIWNRIASTELLRRDVYTVKFEYDKNRTRYITQPRPHFPSHPGNINGPPPSPQRVRTMAQLTSLIKCNKTNFPCSDFNLDGGNLNTLDAKEFFKFCGQRIRTLRLSTETVPTEATFKRILTRQAPHIENLVMASMKCVRRWKDAKQISLPFLKSITNNRWNSTYYMNIGSGWPLIFAMMSDFPNLETVQGFQCAAIDLFLKSGKLDTIKDYKFESGFYVQEKELKKFANAHPQLNHLHFRHKEQCKHRNSAPHHIQVENTMYESLTKILYSSQHTLKTLHMDSVGGYEGPSGQVKFPILGNLSHLSLLRDRWVGGIVWPVFPRGLNFFKTFPNLKSVHLTLNMDSEDSWATSFPASEPTSFDLLNDGLVLGEFGSPMSGGVMETVTTLKIAPLTACCTFWTERLTQIFPNVRKMILKYVSYSTTLQEFCRRYPDLEELELLIRYDDCDSSGMRHLDAAITGIPEWVWDDQFYLDNPVPDPHLKDRPCVSDLQKLIRFKMVITDPESHKNSSQPLDPEKYRFQLITWISVVHGFQLMPALQRIEVGYNQQSSIFTNIVVALGTVAQYITFVHQILSFEECLGM